MKTKNQVVYRDHKKPIVWDAFFKSSGIQKPIVVFCHGYKGFKDWGAWDLVAETFSKHDVFFIKFNFSHNGGTVDNPIDFPDLEAFAENNYSKELDDLDDFLNFITSEAFEFKQEIDTNNITLIGHSRCGGIAILKTSEDQRITKLITWASVSSFGKRTSTTGDLKQWKKEGVKYVLNGRTKQYMPHNYQFYEDFKANEQRLNIEAAIKRITTPVLIIHAKGDPSVSFNEAEILKACNTNHKLFPIEGSNHVFDTRHPWTQDKLPEALQLVVEESIKFIKN
ncbi:S9 family peptidase [Psychroserpens sp. SPM9]|uniref:alpha/beta hydrolase family protein n=1 Tax=Psychroserpens sp. SPM9 TaxID=2975598 RepID=UPI0021A32F74|nr:alpha/beta hydrolase [Psychroserpens sp. SPM9]